MRENGIISNVLKFDGSLLFVGLEVSFGLVVGTTEGDVLGRKVGMGVLGGFVGFGVALFSISWRKRGGATTRFRLDPLKGLLSTKSGIIASTMMHGTKKIAMAPLTIMVLLRAKSCGLVDAKGRKELGELENKIVESRQIRKSCELTSR